ncbi:hypothetical protein FKP32DRAFT_194513 [Trametes sanguinea]|nr:hypothetical protein FKP32DRAFT_194513 [Trametes sanguinea]
MEAETQKRTPGRPACIDNWKRELPGRMRVRILSRGMVMIIVRTARAAGRLFAYPPPAPPEHEDAYSCNGCAYARVVAAADVELARVPSDRAPDVRTVEACLTVTVDIVAAAPCAGRCIERCGRDMTAADAEIQHCCCCLLGRRSDRAVASSCISTSVMGAFACVLRRWRTIAIERVASNEKWGLMGVWIASVRDRGNFERSVGGTLGLVRAHSTINVGNSLSRFARQLAANHGSLQRRTSQKWATVHKPPEHTDLRLPSNVHLEANAMSHTPPLERPCAMPASGIQVSGRSNFISGVCTSALARAIAVARRYAADGLCRLRTRSLQQKT